MSDVKAENPFLVQLRVIGALVLRETKVTFGAVQLGYMWAILEPVLGTAILTLVFSFVTRHPPIGTSFPLFFATGVITFQFYQKLSNSLMTVFEGNRGLMAYPLVKETDVVIARFTLITATYLFVYIVFFSALIVFGLAEFPANLGVVLLAVASVALLGLGAGLANAVIYLLWPTWARVEAIVTRPMFFLSGVFFIPDAFPPNIRYILSWNPMLHGIDWFRTGYYPHYKSATLDVPYLLFYIMILLVVAFSFERLFRKHQK